MHLPCDPFRRPCWCASAMPTTSPVGGGPGLYSMPPDATIGQVFAPYCPGRQQGRMQTNNKIMYHICWPFRWPWWCASMILRTLPNGGGPGLGRKPLVDATSWVLRPIIAIGQWYAGFFRVFHRQLAEKGARMTSRPHLSFGRNRNLD